MYNQDMFKGCGPILIILAILAIIGAWALADIAWDFLSRVTIRDKS